MAPIAMDSGDEIAAVRAFTRFYTRQIGLLNEGLHDSPFSLTAARILYELAHHDGLTASDLGRDLRMDAGYLSRVLKKFERAGLLTRSPSETDGRQMVLDLTEAGRKAYAPLDRGSQRQIAAMLAPLSADDRRRLVGAMATVRRLFGSEPEPAVPYFLRPHRPGDIGWVIHRQAALYTEEYGWDGTFEAMVAEIGADFIKSFDPARECCWIAERDGAVVGGVFVVRQSDEVAKLRMLYVEPSARGLGIGQRLVEECIRFARSKGYATLTLWTNDILVSARRIYEAAGFRLVAEETHHSFGVDLVGQNWDLDL